MADEHTENTEVEVEKEQHVLYVYHSIQSQSLKTYWLEFVFAVSARILSEFLGH